MDFVLSQEQLWHITCILKLHDEKLVCLYFVRGTTCSKGIYYKVPKCTEVPSAAVGNERKVGFGNAYLAPSRSANPSSLPIYLVPMVWNKMQDVPCFILSGPIGLNFGYPMISLFL